MTERTTSRTVVFQRPFRLGAKDQQLPAGSYVIETDEELIAGLSFLAYRRVCTTMILPIGAFGAGTARQLVTIEPADLEAALLRDASPA